MREHKLSTILLWRFQPRNFIWRGQHVSSSSKTDNLIAKKEERYKQWDLEAQLAQI